MVLAWAVGAPDMSKHQSSVLEDVVDGFHNFVSRFADVGDDGTFGTGCVIPSCGSNPCSKADRRTPRRIRPTEYQCRDAYVDASPPPFAKDPVQAPAMTPYGPAPVTGAEPARPTCQSETAYGPAPDMQQPNAANIQAHANHSAAASDQIDQHVRHYLQTHPRVDGRRLQRKSCGVYTFDGREITIEWQNNDWHNMMPWQASEPGGCIMVNDGPLRQPFGDYVESRDANAVYNSANMRRSNLELLPLESRLSFKDDEDRYGRLDAMKVAKEQANFRERAAEYARAGQLVPPDLMEKYEKAMDIKLGRNKKKASACSQRQRSAPAANAPQSKEPPTALGPTGWQATGKSLADATPVPVPHKPTATQQSSLFGVQKMSFNAPKLPETSLFGTPNLMQRLSEGIHGQQQSGYGHAFAGIRAGGA